MNYRFLFVSGKWLVGIVTYIGVSVAASHGFAFILSRWVQEARMSRYIEMEMTVMERAVFVECLFWGALYASALAKPAAFGCAPRIFKHLGWSFLFGLLGCILFARMTLLRFPDFRSILVLRTFVLFGLGLSILGFSLALAGWVHLAFGESMVRSQKIAERSSCGA